MPIKPWRSRLYYASQMTWEAVGIKQEGLPATGSVSFSLALNSTMFAWLCSPNNCKGTPSENTRCAH